MIIISLTKSKCFVLMDVEKFKDIPLEHTIPPWIYPCHCLNPINCICDAHLCLDMLCLLTIPFQNDFPTNPLQQHKFNSSNSNIAMTYSPQVLYP